MIRINRILVPTDFSTESLKALNYAVELCKMQTGAEIVLIHVIELVGAVSGRSVYDEHRTDALERLETLAREAVPAGVNVRTALESGTPYIKLVEAATEEAADLIIVATHGRTGLKQLFLGSTAERVVRTAPCPVLTVRDNERDFVLN